MKLKKNITAAALALSLIAGIAFAATSGTETTSEAVTAPGYGMMKGQGPHHGKMMRGNCNQECSKGNGGPGRDMGQKGMMRGGPGMSRGAGMNPEMQEKRNAFLDATKDLRKELNDKQFAYGEAKRNPDLTLGELQKQGNELYTLRQELRNKRLEMFKTPKAE